MRGCWQQPPQLDHPWKVSQPEPLCYDLCDTLRDLSMGDSIETMSRDEATGDCPGEEQLKGPRTCVQISEELLGGRGPYGS